jgi:hypothetical protein
MLASNRAIVVAARWTFLLVFSVAVQIYHLIVSSNFLFTFFFARTRRRTEYLCVNT